eukprot:jgi/Psemu1/196183/e_gw1.183.103.1
MSFARIVYHPLNHLWLRAKDPLTKNAVVRQQSSRLLLEMGITERGLEDIGDITSVRWLAARSEVRRGDELLQIHFDGHSITGADELYHTVWETFSDHVSIRSPVSGTIHHGRRNSDEVLESFELDGIDDSTVLMEITASNEEWERARRHNSFVTELEYLKIINQKPRGAFY